MTKGERDNIYRRGFEDGIELCLAEIKAKTKEDAANKISDYLDAVIADRLDHLKTELNISIKVSGINKAKKTKKEK
jgi:hypothetical protein